jgi:hypothetical protein
MTGLGCTFSFLPNYNNIKNDRIMWTREYGWRKGKETEMKI